MSYDVWLEIDTGGLDPFELKDALSDNYTSNMRFVLYDAGYHPGGDEGLTRLDGLSGLEAQKHLLYIMDYMLENRDKIRDQVQERCNGWGSFDGFFAFLSNIQKACVMHPKATLRWC